MRFAFDGGCPRNTTVGTFLGGITGAVVDGWAAGGPAVAARGRSATPDKPKAVAKAPEEIAVTNQKGAGPIRRWTGKPSGFLRSELLGAIDRPGMSRSGSTGVILDSIV